MTATEDHCDENGYNEYFEFELEGDELGYRIGENPPEGATDVWRLHDGEYHKVIQGEVIEKGKSSPLLERREVEVPEAQGRDSGTPLRAIQGNASNISIQVPVLRGLAPDETGAER